jgi:hypothetical protein
VAVYNFVFLLHLSTIVIGFGSSFVYPVLAVQSRNLGDDALSQRHAINHAALQVSKIVTSPFIYAAGALGLLLAIMGSLEDTSYYQGFKFSQGWISAAFVLFIAGVAVGVGLHTPNLKAMDALEEKLVAGDVKPGKDGGPPKAVIELGERASKAAMFGGILHVLWLLLMIDMIWKPGR